METNLDTSSRASEYELSLTIYTSDLQGDSVSRRNVCLEHCPFLLNFRSSYIANEKSFEALPLTPFTNQQVNSNIMTTQTVANLEELVGALGAKTPILPYSAANILVRPLDIGRSYLADILSNIIECDASRAFGSIGFPNNLDPGDLVVILPRLSHGSVAETLARTIIEKVRVSSILPPGVCMVRICSNPKKIV